MVKGKPHRISEMKYGSILVEIASSPQSSKITQITQLDNVYATVTAHPSFNYTKGSVRSEIFCKYYQLSKYAVTDRYLQNDIRLLRSAKKYQN